MEGIKVRLSHELKAWQEPKYISLYAILERLGAEKGIEPHFSEIERINDLKNNL